MANVLKHDTQEQVRALGRLGWPLRRIERELGVRRETARRYLTEAGIPVRAPRTRRRPEDIRSKPASEATTDPGPDSKPASEVFPDSEVEEVTQVAREQSRCEPHRGFIEESLTRGRNAKAIWQDLVDRHGFAGHYESVKRYVRRLRPAGPAVAHPRIEMPPGEEAQVDYGTGPLVRNPSTGKYRRTRLFALTLACSRKAVWLLTWRSSTRTWCELHEEAFRRLGGAPLTIVLDNLREGVIKPDVYDPTINPLYHDMLAHYGVVALPARVRHPDRKGKVESSIGYAQKTPLAGQRYESMEQATRDLDEWTERWADTRIHGTTKRQVAAMFAEEKPALRPLPLEPFRYYEYGVRVVHLDGCIEVAKSYYSTSPHWIGREVHARWDQRFVRIINPLTGVLLSEHLRQPRPGFFRIDERDRSPKTPKGVEHLLRSAHAAGKHVGSLCDDIVWRSGQFGARRLLGVLALVKSRGCAAVDDACRIAIEGGYPSYRLVRRLLERAPEAKPALRQVDDLIRNLSQYRDLIESRTSNNSSTHEPD